jgi:hypothetical protein
MVFNRILAAFAFQATCMAVPPEGYHPVIFAGPLMGQTLETRFHESKLCTVLEWEGLWLGDHMFEAVSDLAHHPTFLPCLLEGLSLHGFTDANVSIPNRNVDVRSQLSDFDHLAFAGKWAEKLIEAGYELDISLGYRPYDWRLGVNDWRAASFPEYKMQVEDLVGKAGGSPAVLSGISMAGPFTHAFLAWVREQDSSWADKFVHAFVPVGGPWNGAVMALLGTLSSVGGTYSMAGDCPHCLPFPEKSEPVEDGNFVKHLFSDLKGVVTNYLDRKVSEVAWTWPVMYWMSPAVDYSHSPPRDPAVVSFQHGKTPPQCEGKTSTRCGDPFTREGWYLDDPTYVEATQCAECHKVRSGTQCQEGFDRADDNWVTDLCCKKHQCDVSSYAASELPQLLHKIGRHDSHRMMSYAARVHSSDDPEVPVHCIYGHNIKTHSHLKYSHEHELDELLVTLGDGDQTVHKESLEVCERWPSTVKVYKIPGLKHASASQCDDVAEIITAIATNDDAAWKAWKAPAYENVRAAPGSVVEVKDLFHKPTTFMDRLYQFLSLVPEVPHGEVARLVV